MALAVAERSVRSAAGPSTASLLAWKLERESGALPLRALDGHAPAHRVGQLLDDPQAEPEPAVVLRRHRAPEPLEDALLVLRRDADAVIAHGERGQPVVRRGAELARFAGAILHGVGEKAGDDLIDAQPIPRADDRPAEREVHLA